MNVGTGQRLCVSQRHTRFCQKVILKSAPWEVFRPRDCHAHCFQ